MLCFYGSFVATLQSSLSNFIIIIVFVIALVFCVSVLDCVEVFCFFFFFNIFFFQAEDGIRDLVRSRGLGDVYKRQRRCSVFRLINNLQDRVCILFIIDVPSLCIDTALPVSYTHLTLPTSDLVQISVVAVSLKKKNNDTLCLAVYHTIADAIMHTEQIDTDLAILTQPYTQIVN